jgi:ribosome maturation factor RimP
MPRSLVDMSALEALVSPVCTAQGIELVCVQFGTEAGSAVLRVLIELPNAETLPKEVGVSLEDCTRVSRALSLILDEHEELVEGTYRLEVSSAGIERPLVKARDFERYAGREVKLSVKAPLPLSGNRKNFTGTLLGVHDDLVALQIARDERLELPLREIAKAHLVYRF